MSERVRTAKADPLGSELEVYAGVELVARCPGTARRTRMVEDHVPNCACRATMAARASVEADPPAPLRERLSVVPWPLVTVEQRDIAAYAEAVGGAR